MSSDWNNISPNILPNFRSGEKKLRHHGRRGFSLYAISWIAPQEAKAVGSDPLNENACSDAKPEQAHWGGEDGEQRQHPREQGTSVVEPVILDDEEAREQDTPQNQYHAAARIGGVVVDLWPFDVLALAAGDEEGPFEGHVGLHEVPRDEKHDGDQAEDEQDRPNTGKLEVFSRMLVLPRLEASDPTQGGNDERPVGCFSGRAVPMGDYGDRGTC